MKTVSSVEIPIGPSKRFDQHLRLLTSISSTTKWNSIFDTTLYEQSLRSLGLKQEKALSVYIHLPFCPVRCLYCCCNTTITHSSERIDHYLDNLEREMDLVTNLIGSDRDLLQLHLGGGTPNYLNDSQLVRLMEMVEKRFSIIGETDTSIECNPRRASAGQLSLLRGLGFRRISFGIQDLQPQVQRAIGRIQSIDMIRDVHAMAREAGFECINLDLIYGLPYQTRQSFQATIDEIIALSPDRISCAAYTHVPDLRPHQHAIETEQLPSKLERLALFHHAVNRFTESGYAWVGLDTFVLDTDELAIAQDERRLYHNGIGYTATPSTHLLAFGMGAIGDMDGILVQNSDSLIEWQNAIALGQFPITQIHRLDDSQRQRREAILQLICNLELPSTLAQAGLPNEYADLGRYLNHGLVAANGDCIRITPRGRYYLHSLCIDTDAYLQEDNSLWPLLRHI